MSGPWEKYGAGPSARGVAGPWAKYQSSATAAPAQADEPASTVGSVVRNALGGFNARLGNLFFAPFNAFNAAADAMTGKEQPTRNPVQESYDRLLSGPEPANRLERAARRGGEFVGDAVPLIFGGMGLAASAARAPTAALGTEAAATVGQVVKRGVNQVLDSMAARPAAAVAGDVAANVGAGAGAQVGKEAGGPVGEAVGSVVGGVAAPNLPRLSPAAVTARLGLTAARAGTRFLPPAADREAREAANLAWANREGVYADPTVPKPPEPGLLARAQDKAAAARAQRASVLVGKDLQAVLTEPQAPASLAEAERLKEAIPGFSPSFAKASNSGPLLNLQQKLEGQAVGDELRRFQAKRDANAGAINRFADENAPASAGQPAPQFPEDAVDASLRSRVQGELDGLDAQRAATEQDIRNASGALPAVDRSVVGRELRDLRAAEKRASDAEVRRLKAAVDPDGVARLPGEPLRQGIEAEIAGRETALTPVEVPPKLRSFLDNLHPRTVEKPASTIRGPDGKPAVPASTEVRPAEFDFNSLVKVRENLNRDIRDATVGDNPKRLTSEQVDIMRSAVDQIDQHIGTIADSRIPGVADRYSSFRDFYREKHAPRFNQGVSGKLDQKVKGAYAIPNEDVPGRFFGPNNIAEAKQFNALYGENPRARELMTQYALDDLRQSAVKEGMLKDGAVEAWLTKNSRVLNEMPWLREAVAAKDPSALYARLGAVEAKRRAVADSDLAKLLSGKPGAAVDAALADFRVARRLKDTFKDDPNADAALARAVWNRAVGAGKSSEALLNGDGMHAFIDRNRRSLDILLSPKHIRDLETIIQAARVEGRLGRPQGTVEPVRSMPDQVGNLAGISLPSFLSRLYAVDSGRTSNTFIGSEVALRALNKFTTRDFENAWKEALFNDKVAEMVAAAAQRGKATPMQARFLRSYLVVAPTEIAGDDARE